MDLESFSALKAPWINPLLVCYFACGARGFELLICRRWFLQQLFSCSKRGITLYGDHSHTLFRTACLKSFSRWNWCNDWLISYFYEDWGTRPHLESSPEENRRAQCDVFQIVPNGAPKTPNLLPPDWLEGSGTGGFECWTLDYNSRLSKNYTFRKPRK